MHQWRNIQNFGQIKLTLSIWTQRKFIHFLSKLVIYVSRVTTNNVKYLLLLFHFIRYLSKKYAFCSQSDSIDMTLDHCDEYMKANAGGHGRTLIVCGAYIIGKEKIWLSIAQRFNYKVYVSKERRRTIECIGNRDMLEVLVDEPVEADIHVLPIGEMRYPVCCDIKYCLYCSICKQELILV